jgi:hypothetical protein
MTDDVSRPDTPLFRVLWVGEPATYNRNRFPYTARTLNGVHTSYVEAVDELGAFVKAQALLDQMKKEQLGRRWKVEEKDDDW